MIIKKDDMVRITELCMTPNLRGLVGRVVRRPRNNHYIVKFPGDGQLYIFGSAEIANIKS